MFKDPNGENLKEWAATLPLDNFKNTVVTKVVSSIPLWELLVDPKYAERAKELEEYVTSGAYELDMKNEYDFGIGDIGKIKSVSSLFSKEDDASGTLVKDLIVDQKVVARACKEFIPQLSTTELCIVLYPMVENKPKYNLGYFVGNRSNAPCRVCWNDSTAAAKITRLSREKTKGIRETLYILGCSFLNEELDQKTIQTGLLRDVTKDEVYMLSQKTYVEKQKGQNVYVAKDHKYPLIKLFNHVWTRENFSYYGKDDKGNVDCKVDNESGEIYYEPKFVTTDACRERIPLGWRLPRTTEFEQLVAEMKDKGVQQPARTLGIGGVTGFNAQWTDYWENNQTKPHTEKQSAEAGTPYMYKWASGTNIVNPTFKNVTVIPVGEDDRSASDNQAEQGEQGDEGSENNENSQASVPSVLNYINFYGCYKQVEITAEDQEQKFVIDNNTICQDVKKYDAFSAYFFIAKLIENNARTVATVTLKLGETTISKRLGYSWAGNGTEQSPYLISTTGQLKELADAFVLTVWLPRTLPAAS